MRVNRWIIATSALIVMIGLFWFLIAWLGDAVEREYKKINIQGIRLLMTRDEVEKLHGKGAAPRLKCFGCEMNFAYPELGVSGRYSETLGRGFGVSSKSPKVKLLTTTDDSVDIFGVRIGETFKQAKETLISRGFQLQSGDQQFFYGYYTQDGFYIRLWSDSEIDPFMKDRDDRGRDQDKVGSITIEVRVKDDEKIVY